MSIQKDLIISRGSSMYFTLKPLDRFQFLPYGPGRKMRVGDVAVFSSPMQSYLIAHRIVKIDAQGIRTKGDNNPGIDPWILTPGKIMGRVVYAYRGRKKLRIHGGRAGLLWAFLVGLVSALRRYAFFLLKPIYYRMAKTSLANKLFNRMLSVSVFHINASDFELHLSIWGRVIGRYSSRNKKWRIHSRYEPLIDKDRLIADHTNKLSSFLRH